ncbi:hypothetical protein DFH27DRAFT_359131 [Peziza echinospora]|nr:hypothetical protein DFH27DRAFT_359131 [Peziza echinospora]
MNLFAFFIHSNIHLLLIFNSLFPLPYLAFHTCFWDHCFFFSPFSFRSFNVAYAYTLYASTGMIAIRWVLRAYVVPLDFVNIVATTLLSSNLALFAFLLSIWDHGVSFFLGLIFLFLF